MRLIYPLTSSKFARLELFDPHFGIKLYTLTSGQMIANQSPPICSYVRFCCCDARAELKMYQIQLRKMCYKTIFLVAFSSILIELKTNKFFFAWQALRNNKRNIYLMNKWKNLLNGASKNIEISFLIKFIKNHSLRLDKNFLIK